jgi:hypothetical protein
MNEEFYKSILINHCRQYIVDYNELEVVYTV